jgi:release factor glutamine methyltransferase
MIDVRKKIIELISAALLKIDSGHEISWIADFITAKSLEESKALQLATEIIERRKRHEPLAYIFGNWDFRAHNFLCGSGVLIPRPETEELVEAIVMTIENSNQSSNKLLAEGLKIVDAGAGTGCLGLSLVADFIKDIEIETGRSEEISKGIELILIEKSPEARMYLKKNIEVMRPHLARSKISLFEGDWNAWMPTPCDLFVANPPYVSEAEYQKCDESVRGYEPKSALVPTTNDDPHALSCYKELIEIAAKALAPGGWIWFELGVSQGERVQEYVSARGGFNDMRTLKDMAKKPRFFCARKH